MALLMLLLLSLPRPLGLLLLLLLRGLPLGLPPPLAARRRLLPHDLSALGGRSRQGQDCRVVIFIVCDRPRQKPDVDLEDRWGANVVPVKGGGQCTGPFQTRQDPALEASGSQDLDGPCKGHDADNSRELQLLSRAQRDVLVDGLVYFMVPVLRPAVDAHFLREDWAVRRQGHAIGIIAGRRLGMAEVPDVGIQRLVKHGCTNLQARETRSFSC